MAAPTAGSTLEGGIGGLPLVAAQGLNTNKAVNFSGFGVDISGNVTLPAGKTILGSGVSVLAKTTTAVLTAAQSGSLVLWNAAAGFTITLPAPAVGLNFSFGVQVSVTSSNHKLITDAGTTFLLGGIVMIESADTNSGLGAAMDGSSNVAITMNGSTTGGLIGTFFNAYCISATQWMVEGIVYGSG